MEKAEWEQVWVDVAVDLIETILVRDYSSAVPLPRSQASSGAGEASDSRVSALHHSFYSFTYTHMDP